MDCKNSNKADEVGTKEKTSERKVLVNVCGEESDASRIVVLRRLVDLEGKKEAELRAERKKREYAAKVAEKQRKKEIVFTDSRLEYLLPKYRVQCQKCGNLRPVHKDWFLKSKVLCPTCYAEMTPLERVVFNETHIPYGNVEDLSDGDSVRYKAMETIAKSQLRCAKGCNSCIEHQNCKYGESWIASASEEKLRWAAEKGFISRPRMRIEIARRANKDKYLRIPDVEPVPVGSVYTGGFR